MKTFCQGWIAKVGQLGSDNEGCTIWVNKRLWRSIRV